ncbi:MAG: GNAT family N-acetyltransferase [Alphaproteobacteria bacterium]
MSHSVPEWARFIEPDPSQPVHWRLRRAKENDHPFCERLYVMTMEPLLRPLDAWKPADMLEKLRSSFRLSDVLVVVADQADAGWLQVTDDGSGLILNQMHLLPQWRARGIGSSILDGLIAYARHHRRRIALSVAHNNRARALYERKGFSQVAREDWRLDLEFVPR